MSHAIERYGIYLTDLDPTRGRDQPRRDEPPPRYGRCWPLTTRLHPGWRSRIQCACAGRRAEIAVDQIRTVSKERLGRRLDRLAPALATQLRRLIIEMYGQ